MPSDAVSPELCEKINSPTSQEQCSPRMFKIVGAAFLCFAAIAVILSFVSGAPFVPPTEKISYAIGYSYFIPFAIGAGGYLVLQTILTLFGIAHYTLEERIRHVLADSYFLAIFAAVIYLHFHIKMWMPLINPHIYDETFYAVDNQFRGALNVLTDFRGAIAGKSVRFDPLYQSGFFAMFALSLWSHAVGNRRWHFDNMTALLMLEMIGAVSYLFFPAVGPFVFENGPNMLATTAQQSMLNAFRHVQTEGVAWLVANGSNYFTGPPAAMPSLHVAGAFIISWYSVRARSFLAPAMVMLSCWIAMESLVSRWHYLADLPPGLALAGISIFLAGKICAPRRTSEIPDRA